VSSFAGISFVHEEFNNCGLLQLIDEHPGQRNASGYGHGELFRTWLEVFFCGGEVAEDVHEHLRSTSESMTEQISRISEWEKAEINYKTYEVASIPFKRFFEERNYRLVVMREKSDDAQMNLFTGGNMIYRSILTNDHESDEKQVIEYCNMRGSSGELFDTKTPTSVGDVFRHQR
jgi:hypothetical protein